MCAVHCRTTGRNTTDGRNGRNTADGRNNTDGHNTTDDSRASYIQSPTTVG